MTARFRLLRRTTGPTLTAAFLLVGATAAQEVAQEAQIRGATTENDALFEVINVNVVDIDVWVTDKEGFPILGLDRDSFSVSRDGQPVDISNFYTVTGGRPTAPRPAPRPASTGSGEPAEPTPTRRAPADAANDEDGVAEKHKLWLILYVDNFNIDPNERKRVFPAIRAFLHEQLRDGTQVMIVSYDRSLEVMEPFTHRVALVDAALEKIEKRNGLAVVRKRQQVDTLHLIDNSDNSAQALGYARTYAENVMSEMQYTADALERFVVSLGGLPGRKALIHLSGGIPMTAGEEMFHAVARRFEASQAYSMIPRHDTSRDFERLSRTANANRVVFYPTDAAGLRGMEWGAAEYAGFVNMDLRTTLDSVVPENLQAPLRLMAIETGGRAIVNQNEILAPLRRAGRDFRSFYSLGIPSPETEDGVYHEIRVKLRKPIKGATLRHRRGYRSKNADTRATESLNAALLYSQESNPAGVRVVWGDSAPSERNTFVQTIQLQVPVRTITLVPTAPGTHETRLRLFVGAVDHNGGVSDVDVVPFGVRLANENVEAAKGESLLYTHRLLLRRGRTRIGIAILDLFSGDLSVVTHFAHVGPPEAG